MSEAATAEGAYTMPYEGSGQTAEEAATNLLGVVDSFDEEQPTAEQNDEPAEEAEEATAEESDDEEAETVEGDEESEEVREDDPADDPVVAEKVRNLEADYTRKTQELAEQRKSTEAEVVQTKQLREQYAAKLAEVEAILDASKPPEVDWARLRQEDPAEYAAQWAEAQQREQLAANVRAERAKIAEQEAGELLAQRQAHLAKENAKLLAAIPEWQDAEKRQAESAAVISYAKSLGFADEELADIGDHRAMVLLRDSMKYKALMAKGKDLPAKIKEAPKVLQPGTRVSSAGKGKDVALRIAQDRHKNTGSVKSAAAVIEHLLD